MKKLLTYFSRFSLEYSGNGWYKMPCPWCALEGKERPIRVNFHFDWWSCFSATCGKRGRLMTFVMEHEGLPYREAVEYIEEMNPASSDPQGGIDLAISHEPPTVELPDGYRTLLEGEGILARRARSYMKGRGFDPEALDMEGVGYCPEPESKYFGYIIFPFKRKGRMIYFVARSFLGSEMRYLYPSRREASVGRGEVMFNEDLLDLEEEVYITEGVIDALTLEEAVELGGLTLSDANRSRILTSSVDTLNIAMDPGYEREAYRVAGLLAEHKKVRVLRLEEGDANELGKDRVEEIKEETPVLTGSDVMKAKLSL